MNASVARRIALSALACLTAAFVTAANRPACAAGVRIVSPLPEQILPGPDVPVCVVTEGIQFVPGGCSLHIILDDGPFAVQYDPAHPFLLRDVAPGSHTLRVFAADRLHRAIPGTLDVVVFSVGYQDDSNRPARGYPLLTVNLPQGEYLGVDAGDVAIDFLVDGACLSRRGYHVAYYVDGRKFFAYSEGARYLKGLPPGFHTIRFELLNEFGELVPGRYSSWEKVILLSPHKTRRTPTEEDVRRGLPIIESIKGAMTNGQPWVAGNPGPVPLPGAEGVAASGGVVAAPAGAVPAPADSGFAVRPGGRRVGPVPEPAGQLLEARPGAAEPAEAVVPLPPVPVTERGEAEEEAPAAAESEALTVAPAERETEEKTAAVEMEENETKTDDEVDTEEEDGGTTTGRLGAAARGADDGTTRTRDLRPAAFRRTDPPTTRTLRVESTETGTQVRSVPPRTEAAGVAAQAAAAGAISTPATTLPPSATPPPATPSPAPAYEAVGRTEVNRARDDRSDRRDRRSFRRGGSRFGGERPERRGSAIPEPRTDGARAGESNGRVGP